MRNQSLADTVFLTYGGKAPVTRMPPLPQPDVQGISIRLTLRSHVLGTLGAGLPGLQSRTRRVRDRLQQAKEDISSGICEICGVCGPQGHS